MYIICLKDNEMILAIGNDAITLPNGYPMLKDSNTSFPTEMVDVYEVESVPSEVTPEKYCYTEAEGFYINPDYVEPDPTNTYGIPDETYHAIIDDYTAELFGGEA